ncbi:MAG: DNA polymerase III subunit delta, partial [Oscillospiraceae bacterium]|nr:DNA polymerase III subunit delta [Oscillospiraceae bacterium]
TVIIFWCDTVTFTSRKSEKWRGILDHIKKYGTAAELNKREAASITSVLCQGAARRGCSLDPAAARHLINTAGDDLNVLLNEIEKLCAYSGGAAITKEMIDAVAVKSLEASIFELSDAILLKDADRAFSILNVLLAKKTEPIMILGTLGSAYTDLYRAKLAVSSGKSARAAAEFFNYKNKEFRLDKAAAKTAKMPLEKIKYAINLLCEADAEMKSSSKPGALILEILTAKLLGV